MYITLKEASEYLSISETSIERLIQGKRIRAIHDGEQFLIYKEQFKTHMEQIEKYKNLLEEVLNEPIPEDVDIKDED